MRLKITEQREEKEGSEKGEKIKTLLSLFLKLLANLFPNLKVKKGI